MNLKKLEIDKYSIAVAPEWADTISKNEIVALVSEIGDNTALIDGAEKLNLCYISKNILRTSNEENEDYCLLIYRLDSPELVQAAAISDYVVNKDQCLIFHQLGVIRSKMFIDKISDQNVRILDNEQLSSQGSTNESKKINCVINDLRLGDVLIVEYTISTIFSEDSFLDKKYYRNTYNLPQNNFLYKNYSIKIIQNRKENIVVKKRFFRDSKGKLINEEQMLHLGSSYLFEEVNFQSKFEVNVFSPFLEIATVASWQDISQYLFALYEPVLKKQNDDLSVFIQKLTNTSDNIEANIQKVIEYVQDHIIFIYNSEVMHGHIPQSSQKTLETQAGDCKAKSLLLIKLLEQLKIKSSLILVNYDSNFYLPWDLPSPFIFNHAIVKIYYSDKEYFVDTTWQGRLGSLDKRSQPFFGYYLEINNNSDLQLRKQDPLPDYSLEESISIEVKKGKGRLQTETIYRFFSADNLRRAEKENHNSYRIQSETQYFYNKLDYPADKNIKDYITDSSYKIIYDDVNKNEIKDSYTATLSNPYQGKDSNVLKYYNLLNIETIINFQNMDSILDSFVEYPRKLSISIQSDRFINSQSSTKNNLEIDNKYFYFSNKKKFYLKTATVLCEFRPKTYGPIAREDIEMVKKAYKQINDSNFGVGIVYFNKGRLIVIFLVIVWIIWSLIGAVLNN